jgi:hypothetical protein
MMRKYLVSIAAAASALAIATPAAAQYYPAPPPPGYGYNQGYGYNNHRHVRSLQVRIDRLQQRIARFDSRDRISEKEARRLRAESRDIEKRLYRAARYGLNPQEHASINYRIQRLEQRIYRDVRDGHRWGYNDGRDWRDRDRDGRNDRWEDDRGRDHD